MNGFTFYLEYPTTKDKKQGTRKKLGNHSGNVVAVFGDWYKGGNNEYQKECVSSVFDHSNSVCCGGSVGSSYLNDRCKRISEKQAREIHSNLFDYLV